VSAIAARLSPALLALADQRLPSGGHVHSGGVEQAVADGLVGDVATLTTFLRRRLATSGRVAAGLAAAATALTADRTAASVALAALDREADARMPSPAQREASRAQGRGLLRTARAAWPALSWQDLGARPHHPVVLGCAARAAGADAAGAALVAAYLTVSGPATAAQRLLGLDPVAVAAATVGLGDEIALVARESAGARTGSADVSSVDVSSAAAFDDLPDDGDPLLDLLAQRHTARAMTLFAS
jgi:urease accessory protein